MTRAPRAPGAAAVGELIIRGAAEHGVSVDDYVAQAREAYRLLRTEQLRAEMRSLDGTRRTRVALLAGITADELDSVGGVRD